MHKIPHLPHACNVTGLFFKSACAPTLKCGHTVVYVQCAGIYDVNVELAIYERRLRPVSSTPHRSMNITIRTSLWLPIPCVRVLKLCDTSKCTTVHCAVSEGRRLSGCSS